MSADDPSKNLGTHELALQLCDGVEERIPLALLHESHAALPEAQSGLRDQIAQWTCGELVALSTPLTLEQVEQALLKVVHEESSELGLLCHVASSSHGQLVNPDDLPEHWTTVRSVYVLALAIQRLRLLSLAVGSELRLVHTDVTGTAR